MRLLDLFCCAGGAGMGYHRAGFEVVGVDIDPQPRYPFEFHQGDAVEILRRLVDGGTLGSHRLEDFDAIHASPPCQAYSLIAAGGARRRTDHPELVDPIRELLIESGLPYVMENVPQAPLLDPITLCGTSFDLPIIRHRSFECSFSFDVPSCGYMPTARVRHKGYLAYPYGRKTWGPAWREHVLPVVWPWMTLREAGEAIPPAYTEYIGRYLIDYVADQEFEEAA